MLFIGPGSEGWRTVIWVSTAPLAMFLLLPLLRRGREYSVGKRSLATGGAGCEAIWRGKVQVDLIICNQRIEIISEKRVSQ